MAAKMKAVSGFSRELIGHAVLDSVRKLHPREQWKNLVIFVVYLGAILTTINLLWTFSGFSLQVVLWLWFTVLFANFAEAVAEGRGKAQA
ncbi:MAG TPA: potassium-transporting ATPase subunit B, partial [Candidatus Binatia bacterium]|nr:potassium-transporting ATPase subunit B [Candidatus Binatia bacterium]